MAKNPLKQIVSLEEVAEICEISSRHLRRIFDERGTPRAGYGKVELGVGLGAFLDHSELTLAREMAGRWVDDPEMQTFLVNAIIARWRGYADKIAKLAAPRVGPHTRRRAQVL
jgi:hypothetical protein